SLSVICGVRYGENKKVHYNPKNKNKFWLSESEEYLRIISKKIFNAEHGLFPQHRHFNRRDGRFGAFVAVFSAGTVEGLLLVVVGKHTENHGDIALHVE